MEEVSFGEWLKRRRKALDLTQEQLAQQISCSTSALRKLEAEERRPSEQIVEQLAEVFNIPAGERASFLKFARGNWEAAPTGVVEDNPWRVSYLPENKHEPKADLVTFLFTDIEDSTQLWESAPEKMKVALQRHHAILQEAIESNDGEVFQIIGDAFCAAFASPPSAISAAVTAQRELYQEPWDLPFPIRVRMGIHTGEAEQNSSPAGGYASNPTINRVARILKAGHGGQVLLSLSTKALIEDLLPSDTELRDMGEHYLKNLTHPEHLFQLKTPDLPSGFPPLNTLTRRHNLPLQLTSFIGREKEIADVTRLLEKSRLVTLTGSGGTGKTRLSIEVGNELLHQYPDGVWIVEFAPISDAKLVPSTTAIAIGLREEPQRPVLETLCDYLREKKILIILDNCEHLIEACAQLADMLLHACPDIRILASSRESLSIAGETSYIVPSLSLPDIQHLPPLESLSHYEAIQLFIERASAATQHFAVTIDNASSVAQICQRLDGIPLAIELAAGKIRALSAQQIAQRLDDRFRLLTSRNRTALPRHQTLRAAIEWSYNLLTPGEQILFRRLSVFIGGWTLEAAEQVCGNKSIETDHILDLLLRLVDKSLIVAETQQAEPRYHMLETIRQYAQEKLDEVGESSQMRDHHLAYISRLGEEAEPKLYGAKQVAYLNWLEVELDNFRAALEWSLEEGDEESGIQLAGALWRFWLMRGYWREGYNWLKKVLSKNSSTSMVSRAKALGRAGDLANRHMDFPAANTLWIESLMLCGELGDEVGVAFCLSGLGRLAYIQGDLIRMRSYLEESLGKYRKLGDRWGIALVLNWLSVTTPDDPAASRLHLEESLALFRELSDYWDMMRVLYNLGELTRFEGDYARSKELYEEAWSFARELSVAKLDLASGLCGLGYAVLREGDYGRASELFKESMVLYKEQGITTFLMAFCIAGLGGVAAAQGQSVRAAQLLGAAKSALTAFEAKGEYMDIKDRVEYDRDVMVIHSQLDEATFNAAWQVGQKMTLDEAFDLALKTVERV